MGPERGVRRAERTVEAVRDQRSRKCEQVGHHHVCVSDNRFDSDLFCYSSGRRCREWPEGGQKNHWSGRNEGAVAGLALTLVAVIFERT